MASFNTTDEQLQLNRGCYFSMQTVLPEGFPFTQFNLSQTRSTLSIYLLGNGVT